MARFHEPVDLRRDLSLGLALTVAYVLAAKLGFSVAFVAEQVTTVWAPTGIAQAALLLWGRRLWPAVWLGAFLANASAQAPLWTAASIATGNALEALAAAWMLSRMTGFDPALRRTRDGLSLIVMAAGLSTVVSASIGVTTLCAAQVQPWARFPQLWADWWLGDALGSLVVAPVILTAVRTPIARTTRDWMESAVLAVSTLVVTEIVFGDPFGTAIGRHPLEYAIFPCIIAAAVRIGQPATALAVLVASAVSVWNTVSGTGPFASAEIHEGLVLLQVFMGVLAGTGLLLAAAITEQKTSERRRAAAYAVGVELADARSLPDAAGGILRAICENLRWRLGALWLVDPDGQRLRCLTVWEESSAVTGAFADVTKRTDFSRGTGLPGRVWASGTVTWIEDVVYDHNFPRASVARRTGLHGAFAFPIFVGDEVRGILEFFNRSVLRPDSDLLETMSTVGNQIGQFTARKQVEAAVKQAEREREQLLQRELTARKEAETANRAKDEFLATVSHELRTPLNAIVGWTRMLIQDSLDDATARRALEVIDRNAHLQAQLIGDLLDVSRIITGGLRLERLPVDLGSVIGAALDAVGPAAEAKKINLRSRISAKARLTEGDPQRLQQIVWNLVSNAVKFTPPGGTVDIELDDVATRGVSIRVRDNGPGIDPGFLPHVFERFRQADGSVSRQHGGLGLGLAIVRHLVELHGGTVRAESGGPGRGSTFTVELPRLELTNAASRETAQSESGQFAGAAVLDGCRLLVVDDEADARDLLATVLRAVGADVQTASSVRQARLYLATAPPDVLLADIGMPEEDGYSFIREIRRNEQETGGHLPAAAITAYASNQDRKRALDEGFDSHVAKPIQPTAIVAVVQSLFRKISQA